MHLIRFQDIQGKISVGVTVQDRCRDLSAVGIGSITQILEHESPIGAIETALNDDPPDLELSSTRGRIITPIERQEVWAAGVTYQRSKTARMDESDFSAIAYDKVYDAPRPEIFFKSLPEKVVSPGEPVGIREDAHWNVPEPELALVINSRGRWVGLTIGNDMSSRDIEGANLLYLPQAKVYDRSCAAGPWITIGISETAARRWTIDSEIIRDGRSVFSGETSVDRIKRGFDELVGYLCRSQSFPHGAVLLTGTGIVPDDDFTLQPKDVVRIRISGIGTLENPVATV